MTVKTTWRIAGPLVVMLLVLALLLYQQTVLYLVSIWNQLAIGEYAHGYLVLAISGYLIFSNRQKLSVLTPCPEPWALTGIVAASMLWAVSMLADVQILQAVGLLLLVLAIVWAVLGSQVIRVLAFPILFISFAIPIWFPLSPVLQNLTADSVFWAIRFLNVPALRQDNFIVLPAGTLSIEEACSGLRYLLAALTLGALYAYLYYSSLRARLVVVLVMAGSAVLANVLRVFIVVYLGYTTEMQHPLVSDHLSLGWYLFAGLVVILLIIDARLSKGQSPAATKVCNKNTNAVFKKSSLYYFIFVMSGSLLVSVAPGIVYMIDRQPAGFESKEPQLPFEAGSWLVAEKTNDSWMPVYHGAVNLQRFYRKEGNEVVLYVGYYPVQRQSEELINDLNHISGDDWNAIYPKARTQNAGHLKVLEQMIEKGAKNRRLVWYWYNIAGKNTTNKYEAKVLQVLGLLKANTEAYVVAVTVKTGDEEDSARQVLEDFIVAVEKPIENEMDRHTIR